MSYTIKICQVGAKLFHADGRTDRQTDMTKLIVDFHNFTNAPNSSHALPHFKIGSQHNKIH